MTENQVDKNKILNNAKKINLAFSVGETSGDINGACLIRNLISKLDSNLYIWGIGGWRMKDAGAYILEDTSKMGTIGVIESLKLIPSFLCKYAKFKKELLKNPPDFFVPIDFGVFNSRLAKAMGKANIPVIYYFPPSSWRRTLNRVDALKESNARVITPFPWSAEILKSKGIETYYAGHPLVDTVIPTKSKDKFYDENNLNTDNIVGFLPGSRKFEIDSHIKLYIETIKKLKLKYKDAQFLIGATKDYSAYIKHLLIKHSNEDDFKSIRLITDETYNLMAYSKFLCCCSGTATLEAGILGKPMIIVYHGNKLMQFEYELRKKKINHFIGLPNIVLNEYVCEEILGKEATCERLFNEIDKYLDNEELYKHLTEKLSQIKSILGNSGVIDRITDIFIELIKDKNISPLL